MIPTNQPLITTDQIGDQFTIGPKKQLWTVKDVDEKHKRVLCSMGNDMDNIWLPDYYVFELIESYNDVLEEIYKHTTIC